MQFTNFSTSFAKYRSNEGLYSNAAENKKYLYMICQASLKRRA
jgi:hypothetical protein